MTECERIINQGFLPVDFLQEEVRDGVFVSSELKKLWAVELDLLREFKRVCDEYHLCWWMGYGSLIGTIRHKGFIPWDDDIDVCMPRKDANKLLKLGNSAFASPYFLQNPMSENDNRYIRPFAKLRNSNTTGCLEWEKTLNINRGVFIDIFVMDDAPKSKDEILQYASKLNRIFNFAFLLAFPVSLECSWFIKIKRLLKRTIRCCIPTIWLYKLYQRLCAKYQKQSACLNMVCWPYCDENTIYDKTYFSKLLELPFENMIVNVPIGYDYYLTKQYGDYMTPNRNYKNSHGEIILDVDIPFNVFFNEIK